ncbi:MAG: right-handed parallel beta-helix repeat-containing protein, partial [Nanoarchaeota archaeon]|nr:right-handed parallel beta-helix repeat-containing protein [Nanoarchaeota archaeon]
MKKLMLFVLLIFVMLSTSGFAYTDSGAAFYCNNCSDCTDALNDNIRSTVYLNADIIDYSGAICINNPTQFSNKIFDCQQHTISGGETYNGIFLNTKTNNIIRNCVMTDFSIAIRIYNSDNNILNNNTFTSNDYGISFESSSAYNNITNSTINFNRVGIWSSQGYNNTMINNALNHNNYYGTELATSDNSTMINNTMENNTLLSVLVTGQAYDDFDLNIDTTNTVNGKPIYYLFNKSDLILNQVNETGHIFLAYSNNITIENITISNGDYIYLKSTTNTTIHNTSVTNSNYGIYIRSSSYNNLTNITANSNSNYGIYIGSSSYNNLTNITANSNSNYGIYIDSSSYNNLTNITANSNDYGFYIYGSYGNNLTNARMSNNTYNFGVYGTTLSHYYNDIDTTNTVEGKTIYYYKNTSDILIDSSNVGYVAFISSTNVTFRDNNLPSNIYGLSLINTTHSDVLDNTFNSDYRAIILFFGSANNTISGNTIATTQYGIWIDSSDNNSITDNTISTNFGIGMRIQSSDFTEVKTSTITSSECGITLSSSYNNTISANTLNSNDYALRFISSPLNSTIINNIGSFNNYSSERLTYLEGNTISGNRIKATEDDIDELYYGNSSVLIEINQSGEKIGYELSWRKSATGYYDEYSGPAIVNGIVYVPNKGFLGIMAFNETTGEEIWRHYTGKTDDTPTYVDGVIYTGPGVPETDIKYKKIYALNATTGELIWNYTNETSGGTPAVWNNRLYWLARYGPKYLYALNTTPEPLTDLQRHLWNYSIATGTLETSTTAIEGVVYGGSDSGNLFALNATNGTEIWSVAIGGVWDSTPMISGERLYIGTRGNGIKCLNKTNGNVFWTGGGGNIYSVITLHNDVVFGGGKNDVLYALNATDGTSI